MARQVSVENPFVFTRAVTPTDLIGRSDEVATLVRDALGGHYVRLTAPRRFGKTSLLTKVFETATNDHGLHCVRIDLYGVVSLADLVVRFERGYANQLSGRLRTSIDAVLRAADLGLSLGPSGFSVRIQRDAVAVNPMPALHSVLDLPVRIHEHSRRRCLVALDEFQSIAGVPGAEEILRSHIELQGQKAASYIFAGSEAGMMRQLFGERSRPLFGQAKPVTLAPLPDRDAAIFIAERFHAARKDADPVLPNLLREARGHPQRLMLLAHVLFEQTPSRGVAGPVEWQRTLEVALEMVGDEFRGQWSALGKSQQRVLRAIAVYGSPLTHAAQAAFDVSKGSVAGAVQGLRDRGEIEQTGYGIVDPLLERWLREHFGGPSGGVS
jgi:uncharacterized protein